MKIEIGPDGLRVEIPPMESLLDRVQKIWNEKFVPLYLEDETRFPGFDKWDEIQIALNSYALVEAVGNARQDILRWCWFHLAKNPNSDESVRPDRHKFGGFLARWIAKEKPISILLKNPSSPPNIPEEMYRLNAFFAVAVMQSYLDYPIPDHLAEELAYILHFRDEKGEIFALLGYCAEEMAKQNKG